MKKNNTGMTLIEVIAALLISMVIGGITITLVLSSTSYFLQETSDSQNKLVTDQIVSYIRNELLYASEIQISSTKPDSRNWSSISIENGKVYKDERNVFNDNLYSGHELCLSAFGYNGYHFDLSFDLLDESKSVYSTMTTLELLNLKLIVSQDSSFNPFRDLVELVTISNTDKIYYINDYIKYIPSGDVVETEAKGLLGSQLAFINNYNNMGVYTSDSHYYYHPGSMVFYEGYWYMKLTDFKIGNSARELNSLHWKKLTDEYSAGNGYQIGDVIIYEGKYYQCQINSYNIIDGAYTTSWLSNPTDRWSGHWIEVDYATALNTTYTNVLNLTIDTARNTLDKINLDDVPEYNSALDYSLSSSPRFVKITTIVSGKSMVKYYQHVRLDLAGNPGMRVNGVNGWKTLEIGYDPESYYEIGDTVKYNVNNTYSYTYFSALEEMTTKIVPDWNTINVKWKNIVWGSADDYQ